MLTRRSRTALLWLLLALTLSTRSDARSVETSTVKVAGEGEGDDYLDDYIGVHEDTIGDGPNGKVVLEDIFGSGLNVDNENKEEKNDGHVRKEEKDDENVRKEENFASRKDENVDAVGDSPSNVDVQETVDRVQKILDANPDLPRLSRSEILEIYRNLTSGNSTLAPPSQDSTPTTAPTTLKPREENKKSLLVVLPFNANDMKDSNIEDLFTKRPVTQMIGADFEIPVKVTPQRTSAINDISYEHSSNRVNPSPVYKPPTDALHSGGSTKVPRPTTNLYRQTINNYNRTKSYYTSTTKPVYTSTTRQAYTPPRSNKQTARPGQHVSSYENNSINKHNEAAATTQRPSLVQYEKRKKPQPVDSHKITVPNPAIVQYQDVNPFRPMPPPTPKPSENHYSSTQNSNKVDSNGFRPVTAAKPWKTTTRRPSFDVTTDKPVVRTDIQTVLASLGLYPDKKVASFGATTSTAKPDSLTPEMKNVLESLGLLPSASSVQQVVHNEPSTTPREELLMTKPAPDIGSYASFKPLPGGEADASELKQILANFGLVPGSDLGEGTLNFDSLDQIDVTGHRGQKAMTSTGDTHNNFDSLDQIDVTGHRGQKAMSAGDAHNKIKEEKTSEKKNKTTKMPEVNVEGLSDEMKGVLENLGLVTTTTRTEPKTSDDERHVFNPVSHAALLNRTETQFEKLNQLISTIQLLAQDNDTFTREELDELNQAFNLRPIMEDESDRTNKSEIDSIVGVGNNVLPLDQLLDGPDPLTTDELIDLYIKNEVKRQQPSNETSEANATSEATVETAETTTSASTEERVPTLTDFGASPGGDVDATDEGAASLSDLADSFGGGETADQTVSEADLPAKKPNGLYFLLDWNSFLEVGEEGKNKTTIRFTPRVGNAKNFISVKVP